MNLFAGRTLTAAAAVILLCAAAAYLLGGAAFCPWLMAVCAAAGVAVFLCAARSGIGRYRVFSVLAALAAVFAFCLRLFLFYGGTYADAAALCGRNSDILCRVTERSSFSTFASSYRAEVTEADGVPLRTGACLYCEFTSDYAVGDVLFLEMAAVSAPGEENTGAAGDGILLSLTVSGREAVQLRGSAAEGGGAAAAARDLRSRLCYRLRRTVGGREGRLCAAMLMGGNLSDSPDIRRDFRRSGVSHLLAVSGMHLTVLTRGADALLTRAGIGKKLRLLVLAALLAAYLCLIGFPVSAVRAAGMLFLSYLCFYIGADSDGITSLAVALSVLLAVNPLCIADAGFLLTAASTFGILALQPLWVRLPERAARALKHRPLRAGRAALWRDTAADLAGDLLRRVLPAFMTALSASLMTALPLALLFGEYSLFSPVSNLLLPPLSGLILSLSALSLLWPEGSFVSGFCAYYARGSAGLLLRLTQKISDLRGVCFSLRYPFVKAVLAGMFVLTILLIAVRLRRRRRVLYPFFAAVTAIAVWAAFFLPSDTFLFVSTCGTSDCLAAVSRGRGLVADVSAGGYKYLSDAVKTAEEAGATEVEALVLTHYHVSHIGAADRLMQNRKVRRLWLPEPVTPSDASVFLRLTEIARANGVLCEQYRAAEDLTVFGGLSLTLSGPQRIARSTHPVIYAAVEDGQTRAVYFGKSLWEWEDDPLPAIAPGAVLLFGTHGPVIKTPPPYGFADARRVDLLGDANLGWLAAGMKDALPQDGVRLHTKTACIRFSGGSRRQEAPVSQSCIFQ